VNKSYFIEDTNADEDYQKRCVRVKAPVAKRDNHSDNKDSSRSRSLSQSRNSHNQDKDSDVESKIISKILLL